MEVAVADDSPLGRYLAELDADEGSSLAAQLTASSPASATGTQTQHVAQQTIPNQRTSDYQQPEKRMRTCTRVVSTWRSMQKSAQRRILQQLLWSLDDDHTDLRESVLVAAGMGEELPPPVRCWLVHMVQNTTIGISSSTKHTLVLIAALVIVLSGGSGVFWPSELLTVWRSWLFAVPLGAAGIVELIYQALVAFYAVTSRRLVTEIRTHTRTHLDFETSFHQALDVVKRSELVARGYRLGRGGLPPIARLEDTRGSSSLSQKLQCQQLRLRLRNANDAMDHASRAIAARAAVATVPVEEIKNSSGTPDSGSGRATPSLLITALAKRHEMVEIRLESVLRDTLVSDLAQLIRCTTTQENDHNDEDHIKSLPTVLAAQTQTYRELIQLWISWTQELHRWTTSRRRLMSENDHHSATTTTSSVPTKTAVKVPTQVVAVSHALAEFQASCETLRALTMASQHGIVDWIHESSSAGASASSETVASVELLNQDEWYEQLQKTREQMNKMMQQLTSDWERLEKTAAAASPDFQTHDAAVNDGDANEELLVCDDSPHPDNHSTRNQTNQQQQDAEREFLLVFQATSTGEKDFDLQALLQQQRKLDSISASDSDSEAAHVPKFMHELQDVLDQRLTRPSAPTLVKRIDDTPFSTTTTSTTTTSSTAVNNTFKRGQPPELQSQQLLREPPPSPPPTAVDLQALLQSRFTAQLHEESFGGGDSSDEEDE